MPEFSARSKALAMPEGDIANAAASKQDPDIENEPAQPVAEPAGNGDAGERQNGVHVDSVDIKKETDDATARMQATRKRKHDFISQDANGTRYASPPWKKFDAEGPTSFVANGKRRSGRTNALPLELLPPTKHRRTRAGVSKEKPRPSYASLRKGGAKEKKARAMEFARESRHKATMKSESAVKVPPTKSPRQHWRTLPNTPTKRRASDSMTHSHKSPKMQPPPPKSPARRGRRSSRFSAGDRHAAANGNTNGVDTSPQMDSRSTPLKFQRLRLRVRDPVMPKTHPAHFPLPQKYGSFGEWVQRDDPLEGEEKEKMNEEKARREASVRLRILKAFAPGGALSVERCSRYIPQKWQEPQARYGTAQFMAAHAVRFQRLMAAEHDRHVKQAKLLATACQTAVHTISKWAYLREAKTTEQIEQEEALVVRVRRKQLVKDVEIAWALARNEVHQIRLKQWEEEQEALGKQALDEMFEDAKAILLQQSAVGSSAAPSEAGYSEDFESTADGETLAGITDTSRAASDDEPDDDGGFVSELDDENMSEGSDDEEDAGLGAADDDENLSPEALKAKYAHILVQQSIDSDGDQSDEESDAEDDDANSDNEEEIQADEAAEAHEAEAEAEAENGLNGHAQTNGVSQHDADEELAVDKRSDDDDVMENGHEDSQNEDESELPADYHPPPLEEVDAELLDSDDASTDMSSDMGSDEGDSGSEDFESGSDGDDNSFGMLGFLSQKDIVALETQEGEEPKTEAGASEAAEMQLNGHSADDETKASEPTKMDNSAKRGAHLPPLEIERKRRPSQSLSNPHTPSSHGTPSTPAAHHKVEIPTQLLRGTLREYQHDGMDWLAKLYAGGRNGILADEMGLGKTIQTIALLAHLAVHYEVWGPHLVVVPTSVMLNWEMEFKKWCPGFKILTYYGTQDERKKKRQGWLNDDLWNVCITSYQLILQDAAAFKKRRWHYLILDEAHNIKNFQTQRWQTLLTFKTHSRLLLTGTPLQNNLQELWSLLYFLMPAGTDGAGGFADLEKFLSSMKRPADQILDQGRQKLDAEAQARVSKLHEVLRPYLLRRLKSEVEKQMPGKYEHVVYCRLSKRQRQLYDEFMGRADTKRTLSGGNYMSIINCLMSLRKVCNHPDLFETRQIVTSFAMPRSAVIGYEIKELLVRRQLLATEQPDIDFCGLVPTNFEWNSRRRATRIHELQPCAPLLDLVERQTRRLKPAPSDCSTIEKTLSLMEANSQQRVLAQFDKNIEHVRRTTQRWPIVGADLRQLVSMPDRFRPAFPSIARQRTHDLPTSCTPGQWYLNHCEALYTLMPTLPEVAEKAEILVQKFSCVTPAVVAEDILPLTLTPKGQELVHMANDGQVHDPYHEARIRLSIQFPDKRLLQYDCGKLQALAKLLRELQAGGHRCLIFTQMTKVLDILEQFLNIHGHRYLRLDGATKVEQRQLLTDRFNSDTRILAFILSSRSGGLGINLTGADTVIFYDLDWNPAMDAQCQDRCHRIGQTRDVHIYRFVSEYTIEANILRKSNQKRLLDDVIIQKGDFTTEYLNRITYRDAFNEEDLQGDAEASAAMDRILGDSTGLGQALDAVEDKEDTVAAKIATKEMSHIDAADFDENMQQDGAAGRNLTQLPNASGTGKDTVSGPEATFYRDKENHHLLDEGELPHVDEYMVRFLQHELRNVRIVPPGALQKKKPKKAKDWKKGR